MESVQHYIQEGILYEPVVPDIHDWPIARLFQERGKFVNQVIQDASTRLQLDASGEPANIQELVERTMFLERIRMVEDPWRVDPKSEKKFWGDIKKGLVSSEQSLADAASLSKNQEMLEKIVDRYANEIASTFKPQSYHFAKRFLPFFFSTLLNAGAGKTLRSTINHSVGLQEKVHFLGQTEAIRNLATKGTVILVPTHISNVDSILVGWALHALGLPAFIYGAGLNLFNSKVLAYFMNRLGAYKVDRRKKNPIYRQTLNSYSTVAIHEGVHSLFFPGGTRSRSGMIEKKLKLGLLGTAMEAQRRNFTTGVQAQSEKIFVVPMVMSYHFVLEAKSLINQHLKRTGQEQYYILNDEFASYRKFIKFLWNISSTKSDIALAFGEPMDLFGNRVDENGVSYDQHGRPVDLKSYFMSKGEVTTDLQRDAEYTRMLGEKIVDRYHIENRVFSSHLVAYVAFQMLKKRNQAYDLYSLLRISEEDRSISLEEFHATFDRVLQHLRHMADQGKVHLADHMVNDTKTIIEHGVKNLGVYHSKRPLTYQNEKSLMAENMSLLFYYHNRMEGYGLASLI
ncbi:MAG: 1-acyl-sn-glycerol-3-phosphate acyltransferase [Bacteroidia bacterium]|nr:1-acyl-sn-glycerol-3-phosphate acyltransferase [Bacteroidia bacterium]